MPTTRTAPPSEAELIEAENVIDYQEARLRKIADRRRWYDSDDQAALRGFDTLRRLIEFARGL